MSKWREIYDDWRFDPEEFWSRAARGIDWYSDWDLVCAEVDGSDRWFVGGECNTCYNCLDRHVAHGASGRPALIYDSAANGTRRTFTYRELLDEVSLFAGLLAELGIERGDRVIIYMPMVPEAVISMLACARLGAIHSVVFGGFAPRELAGRIDDCHPKLILSASCGLEPGRIVSYKPLLDDALRLSSWTPVLGCVILQRPEREADLESGRDRDWLSFVESGRARGVVADCVRVLATDPLYILYTSGTTGAPKGVVRDNGGHMVALKWTMSNFYGVEEGEVFWAASDVGWVVGHSYIVYAPLLHGCATILFEGKPVGMPDAGVFWRVVSDYRVVSLFTAPTAFRAIRREDPEGSYVRDYDLSCLRSLFLAGERADPSTIQWAENILGIPVIDHWWQTETGWAISGNPLGLGLLPVKRGSAGVSMPGYDVRVLASDGSEVGVGETGSICIKRPLPPSFFPTLWNNASAFEEIYLRPFPGYYRTADAGYKDGDDYIYVMARTDDIINVSGHRLSTGLMEEVLLLHDDVAECAVIGAADSLKGQVPVGFIVLNASVSRMGSAIEKEIIALVREKIGAVASLKTVLVVGRLPKTRSGKILRSTMRKIADGVAWEMPATIDDPAILTEISDILAARGFSVSSPASGG